MEEKSIFKNEVEWRKSSRINSLAYQIAYKRGLLPRICEDNGWEIPNYKTRIYWTIEKCKDIALRYQTRYEWQKNNNVSYRAAYINEWLEECCKHMLYKNKPKGYWSLDKCKEIALKYNTRKEWIKGNSSSYIPSQKNGWLEECCKHMVAKKKHKGYWTLERCKDIALRYKTRNDWIKGNVSSYSVAHKNGWLEECRKHMVIRDSKPKGYWSLDKCKGIGLKYNTRKEWIKGEPSSYQKAYKNGWLEECCKHMKKNILK